MPIIENVKTLLLNPIIYLLIACAVVVFLWGWIEYLYKGKLGDNRDQAIQNMTWGVVGLAIMLSVYGIMTVIVNTINSLVGR